MSMAQVALSDVPSDGPGSNPRRRADELRGARRVRAFTLLESMMAASLLSVVVLAVISGVSAAQRLSFEGQKRILAAMAADDLMLELVTLPYSELKLKDGLTQPTGHIVGLDGEAYPATFWSLGRSVLVQEQIMAEPKTGVAIKGVRVVVVAQDAERPLATIETFVPETVQ